MGYHKRPMPKGTFGELSKILEEFSELSDAEEQRVKILAMCELADLYGALRAFASTKYGLSMSDLEAMCNLTEEAFLEGSR